MHSKSMKKLRDVLSKKIKIIYSDKTSVVTNCTISDQQIDLLKYSEFVGKDYKVFNILIDDLISVNGKVEGFNRIIYNRVEYQVQHKIINNIFDNIISLVGVIYRNDLN